MTTVTPALIINNTRYTRGITEATLHAFRERFTQAIADGEGGIWVSAPFRLERQNQDGQIISVGETADSDGHQTWWIPATATIGMIFASPLTDQGTFPLPG